MNSSISIGNDVTKESAENLRVLFESVLDSCFKNRMEQETVRTVIDAIGKSVSISGVTITGSHFVGDKIVNMDKEAGQ